MLGYWSRLLLEFANVVFNVLPTSSPRELSMVICMQDNAVMLQSASSSSSSILSIERNPLAVIKKFEKIAQCFR